MPATTSVSSTGDATAAFKAVDQLIKTKVAIGVPAAKAARSPAPGEKSAPNNAVIGYAMEYGLPDKNVPARPFLGPGTDAVKDANVQDLCDAARKALDGDLAGALTFFDRIGLRSVSSVKKTILDGNFLPLSERTIMARARRMNSDTGKLRQTATSKDAREELKRRAAGVAASTLAKPLYDTHSLFNSINYEVRK